MSLLIWQRARRGHALDYERWAEEIGEGGHAWAYRTDILEFLKGCQADLCSIPSE